MADIFDDLRIEILSVERTVVSYHWGNLVPHSDPFSRYYLIERGKAVISMNGREYQVLPGRVYIWPANAPMIIHRPTVELDHWWIHFTAKNSWGIGLLELFQLPLSIPVDNFPEIKNNVVRMKQLWRNTAPEARLETQALMRQLLVPFFHGLDDASSGRLREMERFKEVVKYIEHHLDEALKIPDLANMVSYHPTYFSNLFRLHFGVPPRQFICQKRIEKAQFLLKNTDKPIKEIAAEVGCLDEMYFSRLFRKYVGLPPGAYRMAKGHGM